MPKGKQPGSVAGNDGVVKFVKFLTWGRVAQRNNAAGSHREVMQWVDSVMPWFRAYYETVYSVPLTDTRLLNLVSTYAGRYAAWPECDRVRSYPHKAALPQFLDRSSIALEDICSAIGCTLPETPEPITQPDASEEVSA